MGGPPPIPPVIEGQTYCLRWNNHKSNLVEILDALIKVESYVDCTIVVDDQVQFKAHRVVLAANSPYFQAILQDVPMDHCSIIFPGVKAFEMRALLEYMYTGEVNVTQSQIPKIMRIAEELEVKGLFDMADLKEKFNKLGGGGGEEHVQGERATNPYSNMPPHAVPPYAAATPSSSSASTTNSQNGSKESHQVQGRNNNSSSAVISTSSNVSPQAVPSSTSPPYSYKSPFANLYSKSPGPSAAAACNTMPQSSTPTATSTLATSGSGNHAAQNQQNERTQWPLSPSAAAAAMLSSVYESAPDMNPLKRKKLSSLSSMLMNRDTPILRNVLAQANPDPSHTMPLMLPSAAASAAANLNPTTNTKHEKMPTEKNMPHAAAATMTAAATSSHNSNHNFNGSDYGSDKKYHEEPHSPYTDRSFDDDSYDQKGNYTGNFGSSNSNQKPEWKRYKQYTRSDIMSAIQCVRDGMSALQASRKFGVPSRTLYDKVKKLGITTGRPMNRTMKRSPSNMDASAAFPYAHGYGQPEPLLSTMHEPHDEREERKEHHHRSEAHHLPPNLPHPAAALLDHAFLQQALENRGGDMVGGREALHAMALAAAAHAAANRLSASPRHHDANNEARSPSPNFGLKYGGHSTEHEMLMEHEREKEREFDEQDEDDQVEDLSVARKDCHSPKRSITPQYSPQGLQPPTTTTTPPPPTQSQQPRSCSPTTHDGAAAANGSSVIMPPLSSKLEISSSEEYAAHTLVPGLKRELIEDDRRSD